MHPLLRFYARTWWLWLLFAGLFVFLAIKVSMIFFILLPGLLAYSVYFGMVRISEESTRQAHASRSSAGGTNRP